MSRLAIILLGSLLLEWQLGCGSAPPPLTPQPSANISISPSSAVMGGSDLTVTIMGSKRFSFTNGTPLFNQVVWFANGRETRLTTTFVSSSQVLAMIPATLLVSPADARVRVEIWDPQEKAPLASSSTVTFSVTTSSATSPSITSISPKSVTAGSPTVTLTITGSNFHSYTSAAFWTTGPNLHDNGTMLNTTFISSSELTAIIPAALLVNPVSVQIVVLNGDPMGMSDGFFGYPSSNTVTFSVTPYVAF